jgi:predicted PurR-regulated permease PerM
VGAHPRAFGAGVVSPRLYRALFWTGLIAVVILAVALLQGILVPFAAAFTIAYLLYPAVDRLQALGLRRSMAALAVLVAFLFALGFVLVLIVPLVEGQIARLLERFPGMVSAVQEQFGNFMQLLRRHLPAAEAAKARDIVSGQIGDAVTWFAGLLQSMITSSFAILSILSLAVVTPVVSFFLLRDWHVMIAAIDRSLPRDSAPTIREQAHIIDRTLAGFVHGQGLVCLILALYYTVALSFAGLGSAFALGLLIGVLAIVPVLGVSIGFALSVALAALQFGNWTGVLIVCGIFLFGQTVEANILTPKLVGDRIHLHPVWVIFALLAGGKLLGLIGVFISVPIAAVLGVLVRFALERYHQSPLYGVPPAAPRCRRQPDQWPS